MLKQKILQWHEYKDAKNSVKQQYAKFIERYKDWEHKQKLISVTKKKTDINDVFQRPDDNLFGTKEYPCIVNHQAPCPYNNTSFIRPDDFTKSFDCKKYKKNSVCLNKDCSWYHDNYVAFIAWKQYQDALNEFYKAKERCDNARRAFWGEKFSRVFN